jgi:hypothetical protein
LITHQSIHGLIHWIMKAKPSKVSITSQSSHQIINAIDTWILGNQHMDCIRYEQKKPEKGPGWLGDKNDFQKRYYMSQSLRSLLSENLGRGFDLAKM